MDSTTHLTYTDGEIITHTLLNTDWRDNLNVLDNHVHDNASGQGSGIITPTAIVFGVSGADPATTGDLRRVGSLLKYFDGNTVAVLTDQAAAGTPALRSLGYDGTQAAGGTHAHGMVTVGSGSSTETASTAGTFDNFRTLTSAANRSVAAGPSPTGTSRTVATYMVFVGNLTRPTSNLSGVLIIDGTTVQTISGMKEQGVSVFHGSVPVNSTSAGATGTVSWSTADGVPFIHAITAETVGVGTAADP